MGAVVIVVLMGVGFWLASAWVRQQTAVEKISWQAVAEQFGLRYDSANANGSGNKLEGTVDGFHIRIWNSPEVPVTNFELQLPEGDAPSMRLSKRPISARQMDEPRNHDDKLPRRSFEQLVKIEADDPDAVDNFLDQRRRDALDELFRWNRLSTCSVSHHEVRATFRNLEPGDDAVGQAISALVATANLFRPPQDHVLEENAASTVADEALFQDAASLETEPDLAYVEDPLEPIVHAGLTEEPSSTTSSASLDVASVLNDLLDSSRMGYETDEHFADAYEGRLVEWRGVIDTVRDFRNDSDFGPQGRKATITLDSPHRASAVVSLEPDTEIARGDEVSVTGALLRFDRFTKQIYLIDSVVTQ